MTDFAKGLSLLEIVSQMEPGTEIENAETGEVYIVSSSPGGNTLALKGPEQGSTAANAKNLRISIGQF